MKLLNQRLNDALTVAALQTGVSLLTRLKSCLFESGVLSQCVSLLEPRHIKGDVNAAATLTQILSSCCAGVEPGDQSKAFDRLFLPSVINALLLLAARLMKEAERLHLLKKVLDSVGWLLQTYPHLTTQVLSSVYYEQLQMCEEASVSLLCVQLWTHTCSSSRDFVSGLSDDTVILLLNDIVSQLAVSSEAQVGGASVRLLLLFAHQLRTRLPPLFRAFRGLDSLLSKDWRGRGYDQEVDQLIKIIQSSESSDDIERVRAACVIQAAWRSHKTRRRVKNLNRAVSTLQRKYRARRQQQQKQQEAQLCEEMLRYQVNLRRQQARRKFHLKQRQLLQLLPPDQVSSYLLECERRAALLIQTQWRGFRERKRFRCSKEREKTRRTEQRAAVIIQKAVRQFLDHRRAAKVPPSSFWTGQKGLTDRQRAELKTQVDNYITLHPSSCVSLEECLCLHEEVQSLWVSESEAVVQRRRQEQRIQVLLAHTKTQLTMLREAPGLSSVSLLEAESYLSPSPSIVAQARDSHNSLLQSDRSPWWRTLSEVPSGHAPLEELEAELRGGL
ncbi:IQ calmodulin-binding motif-containing protein 1-like [Periophthalmus magnuspinnatus]|uniref:IQ calmodulin-binding motif-containing protein 1-like n=1 Tax=Periophthalmus magnuspinnatus TaxID=409849 RepID=UPI002436D3A8|nr:IQ calmodulin-binding motif-containing protein 1-like [Periophthalmus magnuspinnatus]